MYLIQMISDFQRRISVKYIDSIMEIFSKIKLETL